MEVCRHQELKTEKLCKKKFLMIIKITEDIEVRSFVCVLSQLFAGMGHFPESAHRTLKLLFLMYSASTFFNTEVHFNLSLQKSSL